MLGARKFPKEAAGSFHTSRTSGYTVTPAVAMGAARGAEPGSVWPGACAPRFACSGLFPCLNRAHELQGLPGQDGTSSFLFSSFCLFIKKRLKPVKRDIKIGGPQLSLICSAGPLPPGTGNPRADSCREGPGPTWLKLHTNGLYPRNKPVSCGP